MNLREFVVLEKEEQVNEIKRSGSFLFIRQEGGIDVVLYQIESFYAEVYFEGESKKSFRIKSLTIPVPWMYICGTLTYPNCSTCFSCLVVVGN
jgi:hypothetical protein